MVFGSNSVWRLTSQGTQYSVCEGFSLGEGYYVTIHPKDTIKFVPASFAFYQPLCYDYTPTLSSFKRRGIKALPYFHSQWKHFTESSTGSFKYSVYPMVYVITASTVMTIFLTIIVFTNHTQNPSWLLRLGSLLGSVHLVLTLVQSVVQLGKQHHRGYASGEQLVDYIRSQSSFNIIDFIFVLIIQFAQVQVIIRLFSRVKEKRVSLILGGTFSICAQVIWGVATFSTYDLSRDSDITILPAFIYLLRIALSTMYSGLIIIYGVGKRNFVFQRKIIVLTVIVFIAVNAQVAFFITDVSDVWVGELSEIFNTAIYVAVTVIPWEWINRVHSLERHVQREGVLGRQVYEDEISDIARYEIVNDSKKDTSASQIDSIADTTDNCNLPEDDDKTKSKNNSIMKYHMISGKVKDTFNSTTNAFLHFTDQIIAYGLAVPRSVSVSSADKEEMLRQKKNKQNTKRDVYIYSKKEVVCDSDQEIGNSGFRDD